MSLLRSILKHALLRPKRTLVVDDRGATSAFKLAAGSMFLARHVERLTDRPHVGLMLPTSGAFSMSLIGAWLARRVAVPLNYLLSRDELNFVVGDSGLDVIFTSRKLLDALEIGEDAVAPAKLVCLEDLSFKGLPPLRLPPKQDDDALAALLYTSGTSGKPKGVELTFGNLEANVRDSIAIAELKRSTGFLGVLPQFHAFGITVMTLCPLVLGAKVIYTARFVPRRIVELMREHRPDIFVGVPSMFAALLNVKSAEPADFESLVYPVSGAEPLPDSVYERFLDRFGVQILEGYGLTETAPVSNWSKPSAHKRHAVGRPLPRVRNFIVAEDGKTVLGPNEPGEIAIAGPNVMRGYHNRPDLTDEVIRELHPPGESEPVRCFFTGDIGVIDDDGFLFITGRKKEMLIVGGENVFPREIEDVLVKHDSVHAAAVIGQHDDVRGEVPIAFIELSDGHELDEAALRSFARERLAGYKVPRSIRVVEQLPRNPTGKILRRELRAE
jgi:long-chain acyl-CoA synthetase